MTLPRATHSGRIRLGDADVFVHVLPDGVALVEVTSIEPLLGLPESGLGAFLSTLPGDGGRVRFLRAAESCAICKAPATHKAHGSLRCGGCAGNDGARWIGPTVETVGVVATDIPDILSAYLLANPQTDAAQRAHEILSALVLHGIRALTKEEAAAASLDPKPPEEVNGKRILLPMHFNHRTLREVPGRLVGYTGDGHVAFTKAARALVANGEVETETADALFHELIIASTEAKRLRDEAQGLNQWIAQPVSDGRFEVTHRGHTARFRPIKNGKLRSGAKWGHKCTVCRNKVPEGGTMYVWADGEPHTQGAGEAFRYSRACETCMRPELQAALVGAALLGKEEP
jgi:hypothetical protein